MVPESVELKIFYKTKTSLPYPQTKNISYVKVPRLYKGKLVSISILLFLYKKRNQSILIVDWFAQLTILRFLSLIGVKIIYCYAPVIGDYLWLYQRFKGLRKNCGWRYDRIRGSGFLYDFISCKLADFVVVQSQDLKEIYSKVYNISIDKILVHYNSLTEWPSSSPSKIKNDSFEKEFLIGFVGNLEIHKGLKDLHFLASSMQCDPRVTILLVGEVKGYRNKKLLKSFKNFKNIKLLGKLSKREVLLFYKKIDALVLPSYHEGSPRVVSEFVLSGKSIVCYDLPGIDYIRDLPNSYIIPVGDANSLVQTFKKQLSNSRTIKKIRPIELKNELNWLFNEIK